MPDISLIINCDTRPAKNQETGLFSGTSNLDYLTEGVRNKQLYFSGYDIETIVYVDKHLDIPEKELKWLNDNCDAVIIRKHKDFPGFNDWNYIEALSMARGKYICHADQDTAMFAESPSAIQSQLDLLEAYDFVSYPSYFSPAPVHDESFDHWWASTRYFLCKRKTLDFTELRKMMEDYDYCFSQYPANRKCHFTEHWLGLLAKYKGNGVIYPPFPNDYVVFSWGRYEDYIWRRLNEYTFEEVLIWLQSHPLTLPNNDVYA